MSTEDEHLFKLKQQATQIFVQDAEIKLLKDEVAALKAELGMIQMGFTPEGYIGSLQKLE